VTEPQNKITGVKLPREDGNIQAVKPKTLNIFGAQLIQGVYSSITGMVITVLLVLVLSYAQQLFPEFSKTFFILQVLLSITCLFLIITVTKHVKSRIFIPLTQLHKWVQRMRRGDFTVRVIQRETYGDLSELAGDINELGDSLRSLTREMDDRVDRQTITLQRKTRSLEILYDVATHSNSARNIDELLVAFLNTLTEIVYAHAGTVRLITDDNQMRLVGSVGIDDELADKIRLVPIEHCLCAQEFSENMILCKNTFENCQNQIDNMLFAGDKMENISIPLRYQNNTLGIYNLFVEKLGLTEREDIKDILTNIGQHLSMAIEKSRWEEESKRVSIMQERAMLAHELHDSLAQTLASLRFRVSMLQKTLEKSNNETKNEAGDEVEQIKRGLDDANFELRELLAHFRIKMDERGLIPATEELVNHFKSECDIQVFFQNECPDLKLAPILEVHLLHIIQESLTNIRKHSDANNVRILMRCTKEKPFHVLIEDDGMGIGQDFSDAKPGEHVGLTIMKERAQRIGAKLSIESDPGEGTRIELDLHDINAYTEMFDQ
jgi:two-component system nitrate/nitrite sensor histidine kinase NarX